MAVAAVLDLAWLAAAADLESLATADLESSAVVDPTCLAPEPAYSDRSGRTQTDSAAKHR